MLLSAWAKMSIIAAAWANSFAHNSRAPLHITYAPVVPCGLDANHEPRYAGGRPHARCARGEEPKGQNDLDDKHADEKGDPRGSGQRVVREPPAGRDDGLVDDELADVEAGGGEGGGWYS